MLQQKQRQIGLIYPVDAVDERQFRLCVAMQKYLINFNNLRSRYCQVIKNTL